MWQKEYKKKKFYWGIKPIKGLKKVIKIAPEGIALDIGAGEGRNSIFLAENGFEVEAIDIIPEGLKKLKKLSKKQNFKISTEIVDIRKFKFSPNKYSLIIAVAAIDFLKKSEIERIVSKIKKSLLQKGVVYFSVFSIKDLFYSKLKRLNFKQIESNTFYLPKPKIYRHFFTKQELKELFNKFTIILLKEKRIKDTSHNKPHFHQIIELIAKKK